MRVLLDILETMFAVGSIGSAVVLVLCAIADTKEVLAKDEEAAQPPKVG